MVANRIEKARNIETPRVAWLFGIAAWAIPGAGHLLQRRWRRAALLGGAVWAMVLTGFWLGGHFFTITEKDQGFGVLIKLLPMIANFGTGLVYIVCWLANVGFVEQAHRTTYEYGYIFLLVAGLLNYLVMLDAFDIAAGRKP